MDITREIFEQQRRPRFGKANPERMEMAFWEWMIHGNPESELKRDGNLEERGFALEGGKLKSSYGPYRARQFFDVPAKREDGPIWTFERYGATRTELPDGRTVCIGGEHEDYYDPDFNIYNDVIIFGPNDVTAIYGYPKEVFPPTDFHTATLVGNKIFIVGGLGYQIERTPGCTPVYVLDLEDYSISVFEASGEMPGWISEHDAQIKTDGIISICSGRVIEEHNGKQRYLRNFDDFDLDIVSRTWSRVTDHKWQQFSIRQEDKKMFLLERSLTPENLVPKEMIVATPEDNPHKQARIVVGGVPISLICGISEVEVIIKGELSDDSVAKIIEQIRVNAETAIKRPCVANRL